MYQIHPLPNTQWECKVSIFAWLVVLHNQNERIPVGAKSEQAWSLSVFLLAALSPYLEPFKCDVRTILGLYLTPCHCPIQLT